MKPLILLIDDDADFVTDFSLLLKNDFNCISAFSGKEGINSLKEKNPDVILLDLMLANGESGLDVLEQIRKTDEDIPIIMITDYASIDTAVDAIKMGAFNYINKTTNLRELKLTIERAIQQRLLKYQTKTLQQEISKPFINIIGSSEAITQVKELIKICADTDYTVLITGDTGSGKELVARQIHLQSKRRNEPFVAVNCAALPKELVESELFGYEKGAFTGANKRKLGKFEIAGEGTIFLDEISELDAIAQVKLLRILQENEFDRIGGTHSIKSHARVIAATNRNLYMLTKTGVFREDLFYRLDVFRISVPPLKERIEDIPELIKHFTTLICSDLKISLKYFDEESIKLLLNYDWPGNVRELQNHITRAILLSSKNIITADDLDFSLKKINQPSIKSEKIPETWDEMNELRKKEVNLAARNVEKLFLENLLQKHDRNISKAADAIGISRTNLHKMIKKCGL